MEKQLVYCDCCGAGFVNGDMYTTDNMHVAICFDCYLNLEETDISDIREFQYGQEDE